MQLRLTEISNVIYTEFCEWLETEESEQSQLQEQVG